MDVCAFGRVFFSTGSVLPMSSKKPQPLISRLRHERCPVCGEISYSLCGVHPQCAVRQADESRIKRLKLEKIALANAPATVAEKSDSGVKPWQRLCPRCKAISHVRKKVCGCGHTFAIQARPPTTESRR